MFIHLDSGTSHLFIRQPLTFFFNFRVKSTSNKFIKIIFKQLSIYTIIFKNNIFFMVILTITLRIIIY
jgi:hypothetical protein